MKHIRQLTKSRPRYANVDLAGILTAISHILEIIGAMLITKDELTQDPWADY